MINVIFALLLTLTAVFLILLVLVQRGRGGGLTGALGGMGGQSAFGAKAGDVFTRITIVTAAFWIILCVLAVKLVGGGAQDRLNLGGQGEPPPGGAVSSPATSLEGTPAGETPDTAPAGDSSSATGQGASATGATESGSTDSDSGEENE